MTFVPWSAYVLTAFGIVYGWILHRAALTRVYRLTGIRLLDAFLLAWVIGLACGYTPLSLYLAFGFKEFAGTPAGNVLLTRLHWAGRAEVIFFVFYTLFVLTTVRQRTDQPFTVQDLQGVIVWNVIFAFVAILFVALKSVLDRLR